MILCGGRLFRADEEVHHKNENKLDDHIDNLEILTTRDHMMLHKPWLVARKVTRKIDRVEVKRLMDLGMGNRKIARLVGACPSSIKRILKELRA